MRCAVLIRHVWIFPLWLLRLDTILCHWFWTLAGRAFNHWPGFLIDWSSIGLDACYILLIILYCIPKTNIHCFLLYGVGDPGIWFMLYEPNLYKSKYIRPQGVENRASVRSAVLEPPLPTLLEVKRAPSVLLLLGVRDAKPRVSVGDMGNSMVRILPQVSVGVTSNSLQKLRLVLLFPEA